MMVISVKSALLESPRPGGSTQTPLVARRTGFCGLTAVEQGVQAAGALNRKDNVKTREARARRRTWLPRAMEGARGALGSGSRARRDGIDSREGTKQIGLAANANCWRAMACICRRQGVCQSGASIGKRSGLASSSSTPTGLRWSINARRGVQAALAPVGYAAVVGYLSQRRGNLRALSAL